EVLRRPRDGLLRTVEPVARVAAVRWDQRVVRGVMGQPGVGAQVAVEVGLGGGGPALDEFGAHSGPRYAESLRDRPYRSQIFPRRIPGTVGGVRILMTAKPSFGHVNPVLPLARAA